MPLTMPTIDQEFVVNANVDLVRETLARIRDAHCEVSLPDEDGCNKAPCNTDRRRAFRAELHLPVVLLPVDWESHADDRIIVSGPEQIGVTRDISATGMGVTHDELLCADAVVVQIDLPGEDPPQLVLDLRWSVRKSRYSYMSGGRVMGLVRE